jgi:hypothetical protein
MARVSSKSIKMRDAEFVKFGDSDDVALQWDGTNLLAAAANRWHESVSGRRCRRQPD